MTLLNDIIKENERRKSRLQTEYDPLRGIGSCGERTEHDCSLWGEGVVKLPTTMLHDPVFNDGMSVADYRELRYRHDFEYWCYMRVKIHNKVTRRIEPFILNRPQRKLLALFERQRLARLPVRVILLKARQWGGSTLTQIYMAWWQLVLYENCNSVICSHFKDTSSAIRGIYNRLLENYEEERSI